MFIHIPSIHFSISLLVVFRVQYSTHITSLFPVLIYLTHSAGIHLPYLAAIFSLATHRFDNSLFVTLLFHAAASTHLLFSEAISTINSPQFFHSSLITCISIPQRMSPRIPLAIILTLSPGFIYYIPVLISAVN